MVAEAQILSSVKAELDGDVTGASSLSVTGTGTNTATASSITAGLSGLVTGGLAASLAEITGDSVTTAKVGSTASISGSFGTSVSGDGSEYGDGELGRPLRVVGPLDRRDDPDGPDLGWDDGRVRRHDHRRHRPDGDRGRDEHGDRARARHQRRRSSQARAPRRTPRSPPLQACWRWSARPRTSMSRRRPCW